MNNEALQKQILSILRTSLAFRHDPYGSGHSRWWSLCGDTAFGVDWQDSAIKRILLCTIWFRIGVFHLSGTRAVRGDIVRASGAFLYCRLKDFPMRGRRTQSCRPVRARGCSGAPCIPKRATSHSRTSCIVTFAVLLFLCMAAPQSSAPEILCNGSRTLSGARAIKQLTSIIGLVHGFVSPGRPRSLPIFQCRGKARLLDRGRGHLGIRCLLAH